MPAGRPSKFKPEFVEQARRLCELGATDIEVADFLDCDVATLYRWKHAEPAFCEAIKSGKVAADDRVERSLYHKALGGDTTAAIFWLKNRRADQWRDKHEVEHTLIISDEILRSRRERSGIIDVEIVE